MRRDFHNTAALFLKDPMRAFTEAVTNTDNGYFEVCRIIFSLELSLVQIAAVTQGGVS